jgi:hypothetical protein
MRYFLNAGRQKKVGKCFFTSKKREREKLTAHKKISPEKMRLAFLQSVTVKSHEANGANKNVPTPDPQTASPVARALIKYKR